MKFNNLKRTLLFVFAAVSICICMFEVCSASEKGKDQVSALQYFPEDSDIICYGDMSALGKMPTLVDFYKGILKSIVQPDKYEKFEKAFSDQRRYSGTSALTIDVSKDSGSFFMKFVSLFDSSDAAEESFKGVFKSKETMMALQIFGAQNSDSWDFKTVKYKGKDAVLGEMKTHDKFASLFMRVIRQNDKTVTCEVAVNQSLPETCFFDAVQGKVKNNAGFLSSKDVLLGVYVHPMSLILKFVKEKENAAANQEAELLKPVKSVNLRLLVNEPNVDIVIAALCTDEAAADKYYTQYKPQFDQTVSQPAMAGFFMNAKMEKKKDTLVISATLNLPQVLSIIQARINQYVQQDKSNVDLDKIANEMDDAENKDNVIESVVK